MLQRLARGLLRAATCRYPLYSGQFRLSQTPLLAAFTPRDGVVETRLRDGSRIWAHADDMIGRTVFWCADHDPKITWVCRRVLGPGDTCVDLGANVGTIALQAARRVGLSGAVHAVEPQPELAALLRRSADANGYTQLRVHAIGLSDRDGDLPLFIPVPVNRGSATMDDSSHHGWRPIPVPVRHAGRFLNELGAPRVRLLKVDIENHEERVFTAADDWIARHPPDAIVFESFFDRARRFWSRPTVRLLTERGYSMYRVPKALVRMRVEPIPPGFEPRGPGWDFVGVHAGASETRRRLGV